MTAPQTCRNCHETINRQYTDQRWSSAEHGDICLKAHEDRNGPDGMVSLNRIHAAVP